MIPQASEVAPFVGHAMIAVAALSKISGDAEHALMLAGDGEEGSRLQRDHQYALYQYEKALNGMRRVVELGEHDLRNALLACLLTFSFGSLQGQQSPACGLASSGVALFHDWISESTTGLTTRASPNKHAIENDLIHKRLQVSTFTLPSFSIVGRHRYTRGSLMTPPRYCPACRHLSTPYEAKTHW